MDRNNPVYHAEKLLFNERKAEEEKERQHDKEIIEAHRQYIRSLIHYKAKDIEEQKKNFKNPIFDRVTYGDIKDGSSFQNYSHSNLKPEEIIANHLPTIYGADVSSMKHAAMKAIEQFKIEQKHNLLQKRVMLPKIESPKSEKREKYWNLNKKRKRKLRHKDSEFNEEMRVRRKTIIKKRLPNFLMFPEEDITRNSSRCGVKAKPTRPFNKSAPRFESAEYKSNNESLKSYSSKKQLGLK